MPDRFTGVIAGVTASLMGALKFVSGLLPICLLFPLALNMARAGDFSVESGSGWLLYWQGERITYADGGLAYSNHRNFATEFNYLTVDSDISEVSGELLKLDYSVKYDLGRLHPEFTAGYIELSPVDVMLGNKKIKIGGAEGFYVDTALGLDVKDFEITPSVLYGRGKFKDGHFNFFYGKPDIPKVLRFALAGKYKERHEVRFSFTNLDLDIYTNDAMPLFGADGDIWGTSYKYYSSAHASSYTSSHASSHTASANRGEAERRSFTGEVGLHHIGMTAAGSLTPANQKYFLFPFEFFNLDARMDAYVAHVILRWEAPLRSWRQSCKIGALHVLAGEVTADVHYKKRKFFGNDETWDSIDPVELQNTGLALLAYAIETPKWRIRDRFDLGFKVQKLLGAPWGIGKFSGDKKDEDDDKEGDDKDGGGISAGDLLRTVLFSGWSGNLRLEF